MSKKKAMFFKQIATLPIGTEIYPNNDAPCHASITDTNTITEDFTNSWYNYSTTTLVSNNIENQVGDFCLLATATITDTARCRRRFPVIAGKTYNISVWAKGGLGSDQQIREVIGFDTGISITPVTDSWVKYDFNGLVATATGNGEIRFYAHSSGAIGDEIYIDGFSILELD